MIETSIGMIVIIGWVCISVWLICLFVVPCVCPPNELDDESSSDDF